jgi:hypothetical protein
VGGVTGRRRLDSVPRLRAKYVNGQPRAEIERHVVKSEREDVRAAPGATDGLALRGVPVIGLGLPAGAIHGTDPLQAVLASERRQRRHG